MTDVSRWNEYRAAHPQVRYGADYVRAYNRSVTPDGYVRKSKTGGRVRRVSTVDVLAMLPEDGTAVPMFLYQGEVNGKPTFATELVARRTDKMFSVFAGPENQEWEHGTIFTSFIVREDTHILIRR